MTTRNQKAFILIATILFSLPLAGCPLINLRELPRVVVFTDPLTAEEHATLGAIYEKEGNHDRAVKEYSAALKKDPKNLVALTGMGNIALAQGKPRLAIQYYERALKVAPNNVVVLNNLAMAYLLAGDPKKALEYANQAVEKGGKNDPRVLETRAQIKLKLGDRAGAMADLEAALALCKKACQEATSPQNSPCDSLYQKACAEIEKNYQELNSGVK